MEEGLTTDLRLLDKLFLVQGQLTPETRPVCRQEVRGIFYRVAKRYDPAASEA